MIIFYCLYFAVFYHNLLVLRYLEDFIDKHKLTGGEDQLSMAAKSARETVQTMTTHKGEQGLNRDIAIKKINKIYNLIFLKKGVRSIGKDDGEEFFEGEYLDLRGEASTRESQYFLHVVMQQAIEDNLRIVYD